MASKILLADDSITIQKVVNLTFADEGIEVVAVNNGDVAERRLAEVNPDLVLADIFMPGKNGYELCEAIKQNPQFRNVPVVLLVGAFEPFDQAEARRVGADAHLTKPFESRTLVETVRRLISASLRTATGPIAPTAGADDGHGAAANARAESAPLPSQLAGKLDFAAMMANSDVEPRTPSVRNTGELASPSPDPGPEGPRLGVTDAPALDTAGATLIDTSDRFEPLEFSPNGNFSLAETASSFDLNMEEPLAHEMIQDFDTGAPLDPISFETEPADLLHPGVSSEAEGEPWRTSGSLETERLDRSSGDGAWQTAAGGSPLSYQSPAFTLQTETGYSASEASTETACATMLAVDEPLGDVLFDESGSMSPLAPSAVLANDSPGIGFRETEVTEVVPAVSTQFDLVEIAEAPVAEAPFASEQSATSFAESAVPVEESAAVVEHLAEEPLALDDRLEPVSEVPADWNPVSHEIGGELDWTTPRAASYSTAQLDSVVMPIDTAEYLAENSPAEATQQAENTDQATFQTTTMWTEEEARFTPIDIEAVAVKDVSPEEISAAGTGFAFSSVPDEQPASSLDSFSAGNAQELANETPPAALSPASIEEIVRRMVAEMSETVVREVAWEVVPDCVERVIEQLTRESLSKRA